MNRQQLYLARRYADAFVRVNASALQEKDLELIEAAGKRLSQDRSWLMFFESSMLSSLDHKELCAAFMQHLQLPAMLSKLLLMLIKDKRMKLLSQILGLIVKRYDDLHNIERFVIESAVSLDTVEIEKISQALSQALNKKIIVQTRINASLIAGIAVTSSLHAYEYSPTRQLSLLQRS